MSKYEVALQITLKAMERGNIGLYSAESASTEEGMESAGKFNAKQISEFFNTVFSAIPN